MTWRIVLPGNRPLYLERLTEDREGWTAKRDRAYSFEDQQSAQAVIDERRLAGCRVEPTLVEVDA